HPPKAPAPITTISAPPLAPDRCRAMAGPAPSARAPTPPAAWRNVRRSRGVMLESPGRPLYYEGSLAILSSRRGGPLAQCRAGGRPPNMTSFRNRFARRDVLIGTFIKTPTTHATEILGTLGFDFVVIDEEHAPFDRAQTDVLLLAARASNLAGLVRVPSAAPEGLLSVLDCGASGVLVPHVKSPEMARQIVAACRYRGGSRGFSASSRAGRYGGLA